MKKMNSEFLILVAISTILVAAIYSSSAQLIFATVTTSCTGTSKKTVHCTVFDSETGDNPSYNCTLNKDGKTWRCVQATSMGTNNIPPALKDAIVKAQAGATLDGSNNTKVPKDFTSKAGNLLEERNQITNDGGSSNSSDNG
jgi:hypothetical protein